MKNRFLIVKAYWVERGISDPTPEIGLIPIKGSGAAVSISEEEIRKGGARKLRRALEVFHLEEAADYYVPQLGDATDYDIYRAVKVDL